MIHFIFEDDPTVPVSKLLQEVPNKEGCMHFVEGSGRITKELRKIYKKEDTYIIFFDLVPNNPHIMEYYDMLDSLVARYDNCYVIPILCTEYYIAKFIQYYKLQKLGDERVLLGEIIENDAFDRFKLLSNLHRENTGKLKYLEKIYKDYVNNQLNFCARNVKSMGRFYSKECSECSKSKHCEYKVDSSIREGNYFIYNVPNI